jgi:hypothetical protein
VGRVGQEDGKNSHGAPSLVKEKAVRNHPRPKCEEGTGSNTVEHLSNHEHVAGKKCELCSYACANKLRPSLGFPRTKGRSSGEKRGKEQERTASIRVGERNPEEGSNTDKRDLHKL